MQRFSAALGIPFTDPEQATLTDADVEAARRVKAFLDGGLPEDGMLQVARTIGMGMARIAEANREIMVRTLMQPGDTEHDLARRFAVAADYMLPLIGPTLIYTLQAHLLEQIRRDVIGASDLASGEVQNTPNLASASPTWSSSPASARRSRRRSWASVAGRFEEMATEVVEPPVRLVKMIGDAAMLVSSEPQATLEAATRLIEAAEGEGDEFPVLRAGLAYGPTVAAVRRLLRSRRQPREPDHRRRQARKRRSSTRRPRTPSTAPSPTPSPASGASRASTAGSNCSAPAAHPERRGQAGLRAETSRL